LLSIIDAALHSGVSLGDAELVGLKKWTASEHLALRTAANAISLRTGGTPPPQVPRQLSSIYTLVIPKPQVPNPLPERGIVGSNDLERILTNWEGRLEDLARRIGLDSRVLDARVASIARQLIGESTVDDRRFQTDNSALGWTYYKPSVLLWERAAARI